MSALVEATGQSRRTLDDILHAQLARRWVIEVETERSVGAGRPARSFALDATGGHLAAARIDGEIAAVTIADLRGRELATGPEVTELTLPWTERIALVAGLASRALERAGLQRSDIAIATVATPGVVAEDGTLELHIPPPRPPEWSVMSEWSGFTLADALGNALGARPVVENDAKLAVFAEHAIGAAQDIDDVVWVTAGNRNGVGIMIGGEILRGRGGRAGEIIRARGLGFDQIERNPLALLGALGNPREAALAANVLVRAIGGSRRAGPSSAVC
jgi:predicted NBD/HSP70 family sugar kinase